MDLQITFDPDIRFLSNFRTTSCFLSVLWFHDSNALPLTVKDERRHTLCHSGTVRWRSWRRKNKLRCVRHREQLVFLYISISAFHNELKLNMPIAEQSADVHDVRPKLWCFTTQSTICRPLSFASLLFTVELKIKWTASSEFGTYRICGQRRFRRACASAQSRQNLRCSLIQAVSQEKPSDRKPDPWPLWMAGHAQLKFVMTECSKTQIRLTGLKYANQVYWRHWFVNGQRDFRQYLKGLIYFKYLESAISFCSSSELYKTW